MKRVTRVPPAARKDRQTVTAAGASLDLLPEGVSLRDAVTHVDERGQVCEIFDLRWGWRAEPLVYSYLFTVRPGWVKGWGMHLEHEDRYFVIQGEMEVVLFDDREGSPTRGLVSRVVLSHYRRQLLNIPAGIWHADHNLGSVDCLGLNFPTRPYDHAAPDKYRLALDNDHIPFRFEHVKGW